ncbi:hypothetical protein CKO28_22590 [Rhodovibrio sodomensis]|uniref:HTH cro/C1-type domain-containing protein n=1 Tax=Rhodovibrio sodomensis TaxID=1088 RepID=A0ABS1DK09_9PROT|nr:helix-turn-helix transcriptional regulator [Rhodovibrio sodomensis]MBK1670809.1 hypothetical protein [Rhodovibrio sodomensis]
MTRQTPPVLIPAQCRAGRALVGLQQGELAVLAKVSRKTLTDFEKGIRQPYERTIRDIREALEHEGVVFLDADDFGGVGVRLARFS